MFNGKSLSAPQFSHCHSFEQMNWSWIWSCFQDSAEDVATLGYTHKYTHIPLHISLSSNDVFFGKLGAVSSSSITTSPHLWCFVRGPKLEAPLPAIIIQISLMSHLAGETLESFTYWHIEYLEVQFSTAISFLRNGIIKYFKKWLSHRNHWSLRVLKGINIDVMF